MQARATATYEDLVRIYLASVDNETTRREISRLLDKDARPILKGKRIGHKLRKTLHCQSDINGV